MRGSKVTKPNLEASPYGKFRSIDGTHPLKTYVPEAVVEYRARQRPGGSVAFFNFDLAREIGLIPENHPNEFTPELKEEILKTFSLMIVNEFDQLSGAKFEEETLKPNTYMATRYLQLQHPCKRGTTSGDGRSIWNGQVTHKGKTYDVSSCGTGATRLSPATNINKKFYQNGDPSISYGCGFAEKDEGLGSLFFSEIFKQNGTVTERVLAVIEYQKGLAINVRVHENLFRPSHFFNHLKQGSCDVLKRMVNLYVDHQAKNKTWINVPKDENQRFDFFLARVSETFAKISANFEDEYIFCWLDWDGDNILMDGGIIDYGSVRQFGLYHHEYRYDDVQRWSTSIKEQKLKAKYIVQTFAQLVDFIKTEKKKSVEEFKNHHSMHYFDQVFTEWKNRNVLRKVGFNPSQVEFLIQNAKKEIDAFRDTFNYFEMAKSSKGPIKVPDGMNWNAIYCMRDILRELPQIYLSRGTDSILAHDEFIDILKSKYATRKDLKWTLRKELKVKSFQYNYLKLVHIVARKFKLSTEKALLEITMRSSVLNKYDRVTGDSITNIVHKVMSKKPKLSAEEIYQILKEFTAYQNLDPDRVQRQSNFEKEVGQSRMIKGMLQIVRDFREGL